MVENELYHGSMFVVVGPSGAMEHFKATTDMRSRTVTGYEPDGWWVRPGPSPILVLDGSGWLGPFATASEARAHFKYP